MMRFFNPKTLALVAAAGLLLVESVQAAPIAVINPGFDYTTGAGTNTLGYNTTAIVGDGATANDFFAPYELLAPTMTIDGWYSTSADSGVYVVESFYWLANNYPGDNNSTGFTHQAATTQLLWETLAGELKADTTYTLSVELYARSNIDWLPSPENIVVKLTDGSGNDLAGGVTDVTLPTASGPGSAVFTVATGSGITPGDLRIVLGNSTTASFTTIAFDNVTLDAVTIPEPSALILLGVGLVSLLAYAWRCRK